MRWIFLFLVSLPAFGAEDRCLDWFNESGINRDKRSCIAECSQIGVGMGTWMCPQRCGDFCHFKQTIQYFFGNGMFTTLEDAAYSAKALAAELNKEVSKYPDLQAMTEKPIHVDIAYNQNESLFLQLSQAASQKIDMEQSKFFKWLSDWDLAPSWFRKAAKKIAGNLVINDEDMQNQLRRYESVLGHDGGIVVVSHSQGNLYSHAAYRRLGFNADFKIVPIASPYCEEMSERILNGWPYTTLYSDMVIRSVPMSYPPNVANPSSGIFDHLFVKHYLRGKNSGPKIVNDLMCITGVFLMRLRPIRGMSDMWQSDWDHPSCQKLIPHPDAASAEE